VGRYRDKGENGPTGMLDFHFTKAKDSREGKVKTQNHLGLKQGSCNHVENIANGGINKEKDQKGMKGGGNGDAGGKKKRVGGVYLHGVKEEREKTTNPQPGGGQQRRAILKGGKCPLRETA